MKGESQTDIQYIEMRKSTWCCHMCSVNICMYVATCTRSYHFSLWQESCSLRRYGSALFTGSDSVLTGATLPVHWFSSAPLRMFTSSSYLSHPSRQPSSWSHDFTSSLVCFDQANNSSNKPVHQFLLLIKVDLYSWKLWELKKTGTKQNTWALWLDEK